MNSNQPQSSASSSVLQEISRRTSGRNGRNGCDFPITCGARAGNPEWDDPSQPWTLKDWCDSCLLRLAHAEIERVQSEGWCDACCGKGTPLSGEPCMCGGTGLASMAVTYLREQLLKAQAEIEGLQREKAKLLEDWREQDEALQAIWGTLGIDGSPANAMEIAGQVETILEAAEARAEAAEGRYHELLFQVGRKYPGESRHETALRYIRERETPTDQTPKQATEGATE